MGRSLAGLRVAYRTFGCKANQYDTERMRQELERLGALRAQGGEEADLWVVNTCTVTNQADAEARRFLRKLRRENPEARVVVAGCSAALRGAEYREMPEVDGVVEGHDPREVARAALPPGLVQLGTRRGLEELDLEPVGGDLLVRREGATRGWLKIQDGCDRKCAFCATRLARGASRSRPPAEVEAEARLLSRTHPELVLTGVHIGHWGRDLAPPQTLARLVARLLEALPGVRFRLGSIEATEVDDDLLELLASSGGGLAPHLHMPLQSGADPVLRRMRRWHTREQYRRRALEIAGRLPVLGLGADLITGFPGETEGDHRETVALVEELPYTYLHVFPFSPRDGTVAAALPDRVPQRVAGARARELRELGQSLGERYRRQRVGGRARVALEGEGRVGVTEDYLRVGVRFGGRGGGAGAAPFPPHGDPRLPEGVLDWEGGDLVIDLPSTSR